MAVLGCAVVALAAVPAGAQLLTSVGVAEPGSGAAVSGSRVVVEVRGLGKAEAAQARIIVAGQTRTVDLAGDSGAGSSRWVGNFDLGGLPNGPARVEGSARFGGSNSQTEWSGHDVRLDIPAPAISVNVAPVAGHGDAAALTWSAANIPDVTGYEVQRALAGQGFEGLLTTGADQLAHTDVGLPPGEHGFRVRALRPGGSGGTNPGPWAEGVAILAGPPDVAGAEGGLASQGAGPTSGVAPRPLAGGIAARLRSGTEGMELPEVDMLPPQVAPRDVSPVAAAPADPGEQLALGSDPALAITHDEPVGSGSDAVRLVALGLVGLLAIRAHRITHPKGPGSGTPMNVRLSAGPAPGGNEAWRGARDWARKTAA